MDRKRGALALLAFLALLLAFKGPSAAHGLALDLSVGPDGGHVAVSALIVRLAFEFGQSRSNSDSRRGIFS